MVNTIRTTTLAFFVLATLLCYFPCSISAQSDTLKIVSVGENNLVVIDSIQISELSGDSIPQVTTGKIIQVGKNNKIEISNKKPNTKQKVTITQTGKNNKVKINSN